MKQKCLKVKKKNAESVRRKLISLNFLDYSRKISSDGNFVSIPLNAGFVKGKITKLGSIVSKSFMPTKQRPRGIAELLAKKLTKSELSKLKTSFDIYGDAVVMEIPPELAKKEKIIGEAVLNLYKNMRAVFKKKGAVSGVERVRRLKRIAGAGGTRVAYKEHGCTFKFDIAKSFFTPRLSTEREIVANQVQPGEVVLDMFAGVGPFSIIIAKKQPLVRKIYAIDINRQAVQSLKENAKLNKVEEKIEAFAGDSRLLVPKRLKGVADRVIMNLPKTSVNFLPYALKALKPQGGVLHYYTFKSSEEEVRAEVKERLAGQNYEILAVRNVKPYAPREYCFSADIKIYKQAV